MSRILKQTIVGKFKVSTIELPFPLMGMSYETMAFPCDSRGNVIDWSEDFCDRYKTEEQALAGHESTVKAYEARIDPNQMASIMDELDAFIERRTN